jgi:hypothetical protein
MTANSLLSPSLPRIKQGWQDKRVIDVPTVMAIAILERWMSVQMPLDQVFISKLGRNYPRLMEGMRQFWVECVFHLEGMGWVSECIPLEFWSQTEKEILEECDRAIASLKTNNPIDF